MYIITKISQITEQCFIIGVSTPSGLSFDFECKSIKDNSYLSEVLDSHNRGGNLLPFLDKTLVRLLNSTINNNG